MPHVTVVYSPGAREVIEQELDVPEGASVRDAVRESGLAAHYPELDGEAVVPGIWGRAVEWTQRVQALDRIELCRSLTVDPKIARRERFRQQGARATGLFARRRKGGKAGY
ncbi:RnfH family protein [Variovorax sp. JS1663]|uniref:RnfH family protein n=1 Tax=Variovorax sp. JS1663 TaxID=1851577 RepID=UPI000B348593|nr:RnfH family protein [Variovorax sp. JS1663]OUM01935.1 protein rnfH [Variovorax sp. JS1663]